MSDLLNSRQIIVRIEPFENATVGSVGGLSFPGYSVDWIDPGCESVEMAWGDGELPSEDTLEFHSLANLFNVIILNLMQAGEAWDAADSVEVLVERVISLSECLQDSATIGGEKRLYHRFYRQFLEDFWLLRKRLGLEFQTSQEVVLANLQSLFQVLEARIVDWEKLRLHGSEVRELRRVGDIQSGLEVFLAAVEKNSGGRYQIHFKGEEPSSSAYRVIFGFPDPEMRLKLPLNFDDVMRDLVANARKYTPMGGTIFAGMRIIEDTINILIEDNGMGIPREEIPRVVDFGYRATNAEKTRTMGGGFGLTKAFHRITRHGGKMWICSKGIPGKGTRIQMLIPLKK